MVLLAIVVMGPLHAIEATKSEEPEAPVPVGASAIAEIDPAMLKELYDLNELTSPPVPRFQPKPFYPFKLRRANITGNAVVGFIVRSSGEVTDAYVVRTTHPEFGAAAVDAVSKWKFRPGMVNSQKVNSRMQIPLHFNITPPPENRSEKFDVPPTVTRKKAPRYPAELKRFGSRAKVVVSLDVNEAGKAEGAHISASSHPGFDDAALATVERWKFKPAEKDGRKVTISISTPVWFAANGKSLLNHGWTPPKPRAFPRSLADIYHWETPPMIRNYYPPVYPRAALEEKRTGHVVVSFLVNAQGRVEQAEAKGDADEDLAMAAVAAVNACDFQPAQRGGNPSPAWLELEFDFNRGKRSHAPVTERTNRILSLRSKSPEKIVPFSALDAPAKLILSPPPLVPTGRLLPPEGIEVRITVVVDREGVVRVPQLLAGSDPELGFTAVQAVANWRFEVPRRDGKPVDAYAIIPVVFRPSKSVTNTPDRETP